MTKRVLAGVVVCAALLAASSLQAHHSLAGTCDLTRTEKASGVIQKVAFTNPHGALTIEIKDGQGVARTWILTRSTAATWGSSGR